LPQIFDNLVEREEIRETTKFVKTKKNHFVSGSAWKQAGPGKL